MKKYFLYLLLIYLIAAVNLYGQSLSDTLSKSFSPICSKKDLQVVKGNKSLVSSPILFSDSLPLPLGKNNYPKRKLSIIRNDSISKSKLNKGILSKATGTVSLGYDYGVIPFATSLKVPLGYAKTEGTGSFQFLNLPFNAAFFYSTLKNISGLNNYFRVSFDASKYKEMMDSEKGRKIADYSSKLDEIEKLKQSKLKKLLFLQSVVAQPGYSDYLNNKLSSYQEKINALPSIQSVSILDSSAISNPQNLNTDSLKALPLPDESINNELGGQKNEIDSLRNNYADSVNVIKDLLNYRDSANYNINHLQNEISNLQDEINDTKRTIEGLKTVSAGGISKNYWPGKLNQLMSGISRFDIGMCYPSNSMFLLNGVAIKGINAEFSKNNIYLAVSAGKTVNNLLFTNNKIQNSIQNVRNLYNYFDFNNVIKGRNVVALKGGYGKPEGTHFFVGYLHGLGYSSYLIDSTLTDVQGNDKEKNNVVELDARYKIKQLLALDLFYGKSNLINVNDPESKDINVLGNIFNPGYRSNALSGKVTLTFKNIGSEFIAGTRVIDPYFTSFGLYFIRKDNIRYEFKWNQRIGKKVKITLSYRKDQNNLLNLFNYNNYIQTVGSSISYKITRRLTIRANYNPVIQKITDKETIIRVSKNNMSNFILTYSSQSNKFNNSFNAIYSYYNLTLPSGTNLFQNATVNFSTQFREKFRNTLSASWFKSNNIDTLNKNTYLFSNETGLQITKKVTVLIGEKFSINNSFGTQFGYSLKINAPLYKKLFMEVNAERLVLGDFYNSFNYNQILKFPYYGYCKLILSF